MGVLSCRVGGGGGNLSRPVYFDLHQPEYLSKIILLILLILNYLNVKMYQLYTYFKSNSVDSLSHCSICLVAGVGASCLGQIILTPTHLGINEKLFY